MSMEQNSVHFSEAHNSDFLLTFRYMKMILQKRSIRCPRKDLPAHYKHKLISKEKLLFWAIN